MASVDLRCGNLHRASAMIRQYAGVRARPGRSAPVPRPVKQLISGMPPPWISFSGACLQPLRVPKHACTLACSAARLWPLLTVALRPRYATAIGPVPPRYEHTISYRWSTVRVLRAQPFGTQKHYAFLFSERITIFIEIGKSLCTFPNG